MHSLLRIQGGIGVLDVPKLDDGRAPAHGKRPHPANGEQMDKPRAYDSTDFGSSGGWEAPQPNRDEPTDHGSKAVMWLAVEAAVVREASHASVESSSSYTYNFVASLAIRLRSVRRAF